MRFEVLKTIIQNCPGQPAWGEVKKEPGRHELEPLGCIAHQGQHEAGIMCTSCGEQWMYKDSH
jgi:hypothetical protein